MISTRHLARLTECFGETVHGIAHGPSAAILFGSRSADKESTARAFHAEHSPGGPFVHVACRELAANDHSGNDVTQQLPGNFLPSRFSTVGLLRSADAGTLYLENVDQLPAEMQDKLFVSLADQQVYLAPQNRMIPIDVHVSASIDLMFVDETFDFSLVIFVPLNVLAAYLNFFEAYWSADSKTLDTLSHSALRWPADWTALFQFQRQSVSLQRRLRDWMDDLLGDWHGHHMDC
ncbi:MAG: sigma 54-interacting transcriptional regulator [Pirellulales bacterium]